MLAAALRGSFWGSLHPCCPHTPLKEDQGRLRGFKEVVSREEGWGWGAVSRDAEPGVSREGGGLSGGGALGPSAQAGPAGLNSTVQAAACGPHLHCRVPSVSLRQVTSSGSAAKAESVICRQEPGRELPGGRGQ